jgi:hypothetical protein
MKTTMPYAVLWRCLGCGKWSTAVRCPKEHQRWVPEDQPRPAGEMILEYRSGSSDMEGGAGILGGWMVRCGPFEEWRAIRMPAVTLTENEEHTEWWIQANPAGSAGASPNDASS